MQFMSKTAVKDQVVADFLADHPVPGSFKLYGDLSDKIAEVCMAQASLEEQVWQLIFDGALRTVQEEVS